MLEHTFVHLQGVGETTERRLWEQGIVTWQDALAAGNAPERFSPGRWADAQRHIEDSVRALARGDHTWFAAGLHSMHHWRAFPQFRRSVAYLDIETTGLTSRDAVTVAGLYDGTRTCTFIAGDNLDQLPEVLAQYAIIVTYNGASFDLPMLARCFAGLCFPQLHVDLMYPLRRLGLKGGLKGVEHQLGLPRDPEIEGLDGWDAVRLWREWQRGNRRSLELLVRYNTADIENLEILMEHVYRRMRQSAGLPQDANAEAPDGR